MVVRMTKLWLWSCLFDFLHITHFSSGCSKIIHGWRASFAQCIFPMGLASLQPWRSCFRRLVPSGFRYLSEQPIQSLSKCWQVSSLGRCRSTHGIISNGSQNCDGYFEVRIEGQTWKVHWVVKLTFHGRPASEDMWQVHHIDGNPSNNALNNLEYVTPSQNQLYSHATLSRQSGHHLQSKPVLWRVIGSEGWSRFPSITDAAKELGIAKESISKCCHNKRSSVKDFEFRFENVKPIQDQGEEWRNMRHPRTGEDVPGRLVSSLGRITSKQGHVSQGALNKSGYCITRVLGQDFRVHQLVACLFLPPPSRSAQIQVNHKDFNKQNNAVVNLEYVTPAENRAHFLANRRLIRVSGRKPVWSRACSSQDEWVWHPSINSAAEALGSNKGSISGCLSGKVRQSGGYEFRIADSTATRSLPGELWRDVDMSVLLHDKMRRTKWNGGHWIRSLWNFLWTDARTAGFLCAAGIHYQCSFQFNSWTNVWWGNRALGWTLSRFEKVFLLFTNV